ncbi:hypothetical protein [Butyrivibrio sp. VCB2001]|uniref:hypothetical protein n=1 Tax=Butyrivibrio sp. VCB2001 TaxID=1280667 RepID=UPI0004794803|nr:hypothetical protein [Butyrivibrio sp. VCB2001]
MMKKLERLLDQYERVLLISDNAIEEWKRWIKLIERYWGRNQKKGLCIAIHDSYKQLVPDGMNCEYLSEEEVVEWESLYRMYEFSDRFIILGLVNEVGNLLNYLDSNVISEKECADALSKALIKYE